MTKGALRSYLFSRFLGVHFTVPEGLSSRCSHCPLFSLYFQVLLVRFSTDSAGFTIFTIFTILDGFFVSIVFTIFTRGFTVFTVSSDFAVFLYFLRMHGLTLCVYCWQVYGLCEELFWC